VQEVARRTQAYTEAACRSEVNAFDLKLAFNDLVSLALLVCC
jgi:hypothetical protein